MISHSAEFQELFDAEGKTLGAYLGPEAWSLVREAVLARYAPPAAAPEIAEPIQDWRDLLQFWDFQYPVDHDVICSECGNSTAAWELDEPRKFVLSAANLGGLVAFRCLGCNAKIIKRHFKDTIKVETKPYVAEKSPRNFGRGE